MKKYLVLLLLWVCPALAAENYWDVKIYNATQAQFNTFMDIIGELDQTGVSVRTASWTPERNIVRLGVGGPNLAAFKLLVRDAVVAQFGGLPNFDVVREDPDEMDPESRVCTGEDVRDGYNQKFQAYFGSDLRGVPAGSYSNWLDPGNSYCRVRRGRNCDGSEPTPEQISGAVSTWDAMNQCNRWRIRLHHEGTKYPHDELEKMWVYFSNQIPEHRRDAVRACLTPSEFIYLGETASEACEALDQITPRLCVHFWPGGRK